MYNLSRKVLGASARYGRTPRGCTSTSRRFNCQVLKSDCNAWRALVGTIHVCLPIYARNARSEFMRTITMDIRTNREFQFRSLNTKRSRLVSVLCFKARRTGSRNARCISRIFLRSTASICDSKATIIYFVPSRRALRSRSAGQYNSTGMPRVFVEFLRREIVRNVPHVPMSSRFQQQQQTKRCKR